MTTITEILTKPKKPRRESPTQRLRAWLKAHGWSSAILERWNPHMNIRQDVWGFADILGFRGNITALFQVTSNNGGNMAARVHKIREIPEAALWIQSPQRRVYVVGWSKRGAAGARKLWSSRWLDLRPDGTEVEAINELPPLDAGLASTPLRHDGVMGVEA